MDPNYTQEMILLIRRTINHPVDPGVMKRSEDRVAHLDKALAESMEIVKDAQAKEEAAEKELKRCQELRSKVTERMLEITRQGVLASIELNELKK